MRQRKFRLGMFFLLLWGELALVSALAHVINTAVTSFTGDSPVSGIVYTVLSVVTFAGMVLLGIVFAQNAWNYPKIEAMEDSDFPVVKLPRSPR